MDQFGINLSARNLDYLHHLLTNHKSVAIGNAFQFPTQTVKPG